MNESTNALRGMLGNWHTTLAGTGLAGAMYAQNVGFNFPNNGGEWLSFAISLLIQALALLAKDASTGSQPR